MVKFERVELHRAVLIEQRGSQREKLHQLARVIFVRMVSPLRLVVVHHIQVMAHGRRESYVLHDLAIVCERIVLEQLEIVRVGRRIADLVAADHEDLAQRERHTLPQLILSRERIIQKRACTLLRSVSVGSGSG
jgi:hypothetical protein